MRGGIKHFVTKPGISAVRDGVLEFDFSKQETSGSMLIRSDGIAEMFADGRSCALDAPDVDGLRRSDITAHTTLKIRFSREYLDKCPGSRKARFLSAYYSDWQSDDRTVSEGAITIDHDVTTYMDTIKELAPQRARGRPWMEHIVQTPAVCIEE